MDKITGIFAIVIAAYEGLSHLIPSKNNNSLVRKIFSWVVKASDFLNIIKKKP